MTALPPTAHPSWPVFCCVSPLFAIWVGAPVAIVCACLYGLPWHAIVSLYVLVQVVGLGVSVGFHRLFCHRSFEAARPVEWVLMILGCACGQSSPRFWVAMHRRHHTHSDRAGDPHSPHVSDRTTRWGRIWRAHIGWTVGFPPYDATVVRDLTKRPDLVWIDRHWHVWYLLGLALPAAFGYLIGGTAYDALIGFLWGGLLRHAVNAQATYLVNSLAHLWGTRDHDTHDHSRNNAVLAVFTLGEGWHNNHHAQPYSARLGFHWWQMDMGWCLIWCLERVGLVWDVKRPRLEKSQQTATATEPEPLAASRAI